MKITKIAPIFVLFILGLFSAIKLEAGNDALWEYFLKGEYEQLIQETDDITRKAPENKTDADIYYLRGVSFIEMGQPNPARRSLTQLLEYYPNSKYTDAAKISLADCLIIEREPDKAAAAYEDFINSHSSSPLLSQASFKLAEAKRKAGRWGEARALHKALREKFPNSLEASLSSDIISRDEFCFTLQVGSFINGENARELMQKFINEGFVAYISETVRLGRVYYRVRVGKLPTLQEAEALKEKLRQEGYTVRMYP